MNRKHHLKCTGFDSNFAMFILLTYKLNKLCKQVTASEQSNRKQHFEHFREQNKQPLLGKWVFFSFTSKSEQFPTKELQNDHWPLSIHRVCAIIVLSLNAEKIIHSFFRGCFTFFPWFFSSVSREFVFNYSFEVIFRSLLPLHQSHYTFAQRYSLLGA